MRRAILIFFVLLIPIVSATLDEQNSWKIDIDNGYISTKPLIVEDQVIVRTSGFWINQDRPHVYSFDLITGEENWRYRSNNSTQHDLSPLLFVNSGKGNCGSWSSMVIVGWTDGKVTALDIYTGNELWSAQTEVITWGITGEMALDEDLVVVPTRKGLSSFCLADGVLDLRVNLPELGWRNGVTVTDEAYWLGNEEGVLNKIYRNGTVENQAIGVGKIRHAPIPTPHGIFVHMQTDEGSILFVGNESIGVSGSSPAIPTIYQNKIHASTSSEYLIIDCDSSNCVINDRISFHSNGEIVVNQLANGEYNVWLPSNNAEGGWGIFADTSLLRMHVTEDDTYTTAGPGFGKLNSIALGSDSGVLHVSFTGESAQDDTGIFETFILFIILCSVLALVIGFALDKRELSQKAFVVLILFISIQILPQVSNSWSEAIDIQIESEGDWNESWPDEWIGTQIVVIELPEGELLIGGMSGHENVEQLTDEAAIQLDINITKETHSIGTWITSFNGFAGEGWEFTIDGEKSPLGISDAKVSEDSVVRWLLA
ncbi:MAG: PQQ-binding-like beta-propeller repeat protein [Candidatus Poseidoniaceae archaeon]|jgi:hypothetical protein|nr:PQQ-binding-like beta-propeller repeat protein [Candidatus Poseidoniaceae archaeon]